MARRPLRRGFVGAQRARSRASHLAPRARPPGLHDPETPARRIWTCPAELHRYRSRRAAIFPGGQGVRRLQTSLPRRAATRYSRSPLSARASADPARAGRCPQWSPRQLSGQPRLTTPAPGAGTFVPTDAVAGKRRLEMARRTLDLARQGILSCRARTARTVLTSAEGRLWAQRHLPRGSPDISPALRRP